MHYWATSTKRYSRTCSRLASMSCRNSARWMAPPRLVCCTIYRLASTACRLSKCYASWKPRACDFWPPTSGLRKFRNYSPSRNRLRAELDELGTLTRRFWRLGGEHDALADAIEAAEAEVGHAEQESRLTEVAATLAPRWDARQVLDSRLAALGPVEKFPPDALRRMNEISCGDRPPAATRRADCQSASSAAQRAGGPTGADAGLATIGANRGLGRA